MAIDFDNLEKQIAERGKTQTLENGVTLITENAPGSGLAKGNIQVHAGSGYEAPEDHGVMHFLEHMCFGESRLYSDRQLRNIQASLIGLELNASTSAFAVNYPIRGANDSEYLLQENFPSAFRIVSDLVFFPQTTEESRQRENLIVHREKAEFDQREAENPFRPILKKITDKVYSENPVLSNCSLGTHESIDKITVDKLKQYHSKLFVGQNVIASIVGDLNGKQNVADSVKKMLLEIPAGQKNTPLEVISEKPFRGTEKMEFDSPVQGDAKVEVYYRIPSSMSIEGQTMHILDFILGGGANSLLFKNVREENGLVYKITSSVEGHYQAGTLAIRYSVAPKHIDESLEMVEDCISRLKQGLFDYRLVDAYKSAHAPSVLAVMQNHGWIRGELVDRYNKERFGFRTGLERVKAIINGSAKDVVNAANQYLGNDKLIVIVK
jgi:predicted Zn-dependent peptidase